MSIVPTGVEAVMVLVSVVVGGMDLIKAVMTLIPSSDWWSHTRGGAGGWGVKGSWFQCVETFLHNNPPPGRKQYSGSLDVRRK